MEIYKIRQTLKEQKSPKEQLEEDHSELIAIKFCSITVQISNFIFLGMDTYSGSYRNSGFLWPYWICWFLITAIMVFSHVKQKPHLFRVCIQLIIIRNLVPWLNLEDREIFDDLGKLLQWN